MAQVFVSGTWRMDKAAGYREQATALGRALADVGHDLACGPGTGIARFVIDGYRAAPSRGVVRYYLPDPRHMSVVGEEVCDGADEIVQTELDYPMRNVLQVQQSDALFVLTGGDGALEEALPALIDYRQPVAAVRGAGSAAAALELLLGVFPGWSDQLMLGLDVDALLPEFLAKVRALPARAKPRLSHG